MKAGGSFRNVERNQTLLVSRAHCPLAVARVSERDGFAPHHRAPPARVRERQEPPLRHHASQAGSAPARARFRGGVARIRAALQATLMACLNTIGAACDTLFASRAIATQELNDEPVFILGHPRTGTTHLHNLLSKIRGSRTPQPLRVGFPSGFLAYGRLALRLCPCNGGREAPMDNMALAWNTPQEHHRDRRQSILRRRVAVHAAVFPRREALLEILRFSRRRRSRLTRWKDASMYFLKKTQFAAGGSHKRLLLKSPVHTARVRILREMFPKAQFVFIHRHPRGVSVRRAHGGRPLLAVSSPETGMLQDTQEFILHQGERCCTRRTRVTQRERERKTEVRFERLNAHRVGTLERVYVVGMGERRSTACDPSSSGIGTVWRILRQNAARGGEKKCCWRRRWRANSWHAWFRDFGYE